MMDARRAAGESILREHGLAAARLDATGPEGEIAAIQVAPADWDALLESDSAAVIAGIRALGFRYVALDMLPLEP
jgi:hypothetical protein